MRGGLLLLPVVFLWCAPGHGGDRQTWDFVKSGDMVQLVYGVPESDVVTVSFRCEGSPKRIEIVSTVVPAKLRMGQSAQTVLRNGRKMAGYDGKIGRDSIDAPFHFQAEVPAEAQVTEILKGGSSLAIGAAGKKQRIPLRGISVPLAQFETQCFGR
jgi:hypothetical protein